MANLELFRRNWDPFRDLALTGKSFDRIFEDLYPRRANGTENLSLTPSVQLTETKTNYLMKFDLPGLTKEKIKIDLHDNTLTVSGERSFEKSAGDEDRDVTEHINEVYYGAFTRSFSFPENVDAEKTAAKYENGVLSLTISKMEATAKRQIPIK